MKTVILGAGNVATHLAETFQANGHEIVQIYNRTPQSAMALAQRLNTDYCHSLSQLKKADLYIYAISDNALESVIHEMPVISGIHVHTAGSVDINVFGNKFGQFGVFYPLQTFSKDKKVNFEEIPVFVEGNNENVAKMLFEIAGTITPKAGLATSEQRLKLHVAAVFACNFSNYLYTVAADMLKSAGMSFDILHPLILETAEKIQTLSPAEAQTGPARRNDTTTMQKHLDTIASPQLQKIYSEISRLISERYND